MTWTELVGQVRQAKCKILTMKQLREALGHERLGANVTEQIKSKLESEYLGCASPLERDQDAKVLLYDAKWSELQHLLEFVSDLRTGKLRITSEFPEPIYVNECRKLLRTVKYFSDDRAPID